MTILDAQNLFSSYQAITASAASQNIVDLLADRNLAAGEQVFLDFWVTESFTGAANLTVQVQQDTVEAFTSAETLYASEALVAATLVAGYQLRVPVMPRNTQRYLRLNYVVAGGSFTTGVVNAGMALDVQDVKAYPGVVG